MQVERYGYRKRGVIFFLHGFLGTPADWRAIAEEFAGEWESVLVTLPGHESQAKHPILSLSESAAELAEMIKSVLPSPVHLVGYSMGGRIALSATLDHRLDLASLTLVSASPGIEKQDERGERFRSDNELASRMLAEPWESFLNDWYNLPLFHSPAMTPELRQIRLDQARHHSPQRMAAALRALGTGNQPSYWELLGNLPDRTHLLVGEFDHKFHAIAMEMQNRNSRMMIETLPNAGHALHLEYPRECTKRIRRILLDTHGRNS